MKKNLTFMIVLVSIGLFIFLGVMFGKYITKASGVETSSAACPVTMEEVIASAKGDVYDVRTFSSHVDPPSYILATYSVTGNKITDPVFDPIPNELLDEQKNSLLQNEAWQTFTQLIPQKNRQMVSQYMIFTDGSENTLAAVDQTSDDLTQWIIEVDIADLEKKDALLFTLIHEYAHILTLNSTQAITDVEIYNDPANEDLIASKAAACPNYFTGGGCSLPDSYVNAFYQRFWVDITPEWEKIDKLQYADDLFPYYEGLYQFYLAHQDQFLDDYSTTHPTEDIAESFAYFVFSPKPSDTTLIKSQKISFFYEYPELVELRKSILQGTCSTAQ